mmetsp:Transcript_16208/g.48161  ORF Transcript_16208/g.48161 Transcript_16208/m.48161 type:complete len:253 (-) Transcript_16208:246-1004(-)
MGHISGYQKTVNRTSTIAAEQPHCAMRSPWTVYAASSARQRSAEYRHAASPLWGRQRQHDHPLALEPLRHKEIALQGDHGEGDRAQQDCQERPVRDRDDPALVQRQHQCHHGACPRESVVSREEHLGPPRVRPGQVLDPRLAFEEQMRRHWDVQQQRRTHADCESLVKLAAADPTIYDEDSMPDCHQCYGSEDGVQGLEPHRILWQDAQALIGEEEVEGRRVHEPGRLQVPFLPEAQQLHPILEGSRQQGRL